MQCPDQLHERLERLAQVSGSANPEAVALEALRRYVSAHDEELIEQQVLRDVAWGLHGHE